MDSIFKERRATTCRLVAIQVTIIFDLKETIRIFLYSRPALLYRLLIHIYPRKTKQKAQILQKNTKRCTTRRQHFIKSFQPRQNNQRKKTKKEKKSQQLLLLHPHHHHHHCAGSMLVLHTLNWRL